MSRPYPQGPAHSTPGLCCLSFTWLRSDAGRRCTPRNRRQWSRSPRAPGGSAGSGSWCGPRRGGGPRAGPGPVRGPAAGRVGRVQPERSVSSLPLAFFSRFRTRTLRLGCSLKRVEMRPVEVVDEVAERKSGLLHAHNEVLRPGVRMVGRRADLEEGADVARASLPHGDAGDEHRAPGLLSLPILRLAAGGTVRVT